MATTPILVSEGSDKEVLFDENAGEHVQLTKLALQTTGSMAIAPSAASIPCATANLSSVAANASSVSLLAANADRRGLVIVNDGSQTLLVKFGTTASATSFTYRVLAGSTLELVGPVIYTGDIDGIWDVANGNARITEIEGV